MFEHLTLWHLTYWISSLSFSQFGWPEGMAKHWENWFFFFFFSNWAFFSHEKCKWNVYDNQISRRRLINFWWPKDQVQFLSLYKEDKSRQFKDIASTSMTMLDHQTIANLDVFSKIILLEYNWWLHQSWFLYINRLDLST